MTKRPIITVVGSFAVGLMIRTPHLPIVGETLRGSDFDMGPGGKGSNQAVANARLGAESSLVGIIGDDKLADIATDLYAAEGVNTAYLKRTSEKPTGVGFIILNDAGNNFIILDMGANNLMDATYVDLAEAQIARSDSVMAVLEIPIEAAARALELGKKHGVRTILNPAPAALLPDSIFSQIDILTPNESELRIIMGLKPDDPTPNAELAAQLKARGVQTLIVTLGGKGALVYTDDGVSEVHSIPVDIVDTTGAGDAFNSGLSVALAEGRPLIEAVKYGCVTGALACTKLGVIPSLTTRAIADRTFAQYN